MLRIKYLMIFLMVLVFVGISQLSMALSIDWNTEITIFDGNLGGTPADWRGTKEDNETEDGTQIGQNWDLEGFFLDGSLLTMVGGYDFNDGVNGITSGDIFIDTNGDLSSYEYVLDMNFSTYKYTVYESTVYTPFTTIGTSHVTASNPWKYDSGGTALSGWTDVSFEYAEAVTGSPFLGYNADDNHNAVQVDLGFLGDATDFTAHFTMECGNDNLMGKGTTAVPEPSTMILLGMGLIGMSALGRKRMKQS